MSKVAAKTKKATRGSTKSAPTRAPERCAGGDRQLASALGAAHGVRAEAREHVRHAAAAAHALLVPTLHGGRGDERAHRRLLRALRRALVALQAVGLEIDALGRVARGDSAQRGALSLRGLDLVAAARSAA